jgi:catechol 2,3-dioxygenase-like lactoylglutathione lyase family enzyme
VNLWYRVSDLDAAQVFYARLGFEEVYRDEEGRWSRVVRDGAEVALSEDESLATATDEEGGVLTLDVPDVKAEAERLREAGVEVGVVVEIPGTIRILDVYDPDGNRIQLTQPL